MALALGVDTHTRMDVQTQSYTQKGQNHNLNRMMFYMCVLYTGVCVCAY